MGAYEFIKGLRERGGELINHYIIRGGSYIEYCEPNEEKIKVIVLTKA